MSQSIVGHVFRAASLVALVATAAQAQTPVSKDAPAGQPPAGRGQGGGARQLQMMKDSLGLSDAQFAKVDSIMTAYRGKMPQMTPGTPPSDEDRQKMMAMRQEQTTAIKAVLTADQAAKYDALMASMRGGRGGGRPQPTR